MTPNTGCDQGRNSLASLNATRRVVSLPPIHAREFDSLRLRMQQPPPARSKWSRIGHLILFAVVVTVLSLLKLKGQS